MDCIFCNINDNKDNFFIIWETEHIYAILDKFPASKGHTLLISKKHFKNIAELTIDVWLDIFFVLKKVVNKFELEFKPAGFNFISNMNDISYQKIFHFHFHIIPKYEADKGFVLTIKDSPSIINLKKIYDKLKL